MEPSDILCRQNAEDRRLLGRSGLDAWIEGAYRKRAIFVHTLLSAGWRVFVSRNVAGAECGI